MIAQVLILGWLLDPSSELRLAEHVYARTALADVFGVPVAKINDDRLYRALDELAQIMLVDVAVDTTAGVTLWKRCIAQSTKLQATLPHQLKLSLPAHLGVTIGQADVVTQINPKINDLSVKSSTLTR